MSWNLPYSTAMLISLTVRTSYAFLSLPANVTADWKQRLRVLPNGKPRLEVVAILFHLRSFYLDVLQWSQTRPDIWAKYACPSPIRESDLASNRKSVLQQKARTHARIRLLQPLLSQFVAHVHARLEESKRLLDAALRCGEGNNFELMARDTTESTTERPRRNGETQSRQS